MFLFLITLETRQFNFRMAESDKYLMTVSNPDNPIILSSFESASAFEITPLAVLAEKVYIKKAENRNLAWNYDTSKDRLIVSNFKPEKKYEFRLVPANLNQRTFWIVQSDECLTYDKPALEFRLKKCENNDKLQLYILENVPDVDALKAEVNEFNYISMANKKAALLNQVKETHLLENEGENLIYNIFNMLGKVSYCLDSMGVCQYADENVKRVYASFTYS